MVSELQIPFFLVPWIYYDVGSLAAGQSGEATCVWSRRWRSPGSSNSNSEHCAGLWALLRCSAHFVQWVFSPPCWWSIPGRFSVPVSLGFQNPVSQPSVWSFLPISHWHLIKFPGKNQTIYKILCLVSHTFFFLCCVYCSQHSFCLSISLAYWWGQLLLPSPLCDKGFLLQCGGG